MENPFTIYVTARAVMNDLQHPEAREAAVQRLREDRFGRVLLESYRAGVVVDEAMLAETRDFFEGEGFETLGGLMPVYGDGFGRSGQGIELRGPFFCYSSEETVAVLEAELRKLARLFGEVVLDDGFLTACRCPLCQEGRQGRTWDVFRRDLLAGVAQRWRQAVHEERPDGRFIVKFPQYYDRLHRFGYDAGRFADLFDAVWVGTETRDPETLAYGYVEPYQAYVNMQWTRAWAGEKFEGAWFDYLDCDEQIFYEQGLTTFLGAPKHIAVFCFGSGVFGGSKMKRLAAAVPAFNELRSWAVNPRGVHVVKPPNSDGGRDLFLPDYLGMMGIPCLHATALDPAMKSVIVTAHAMADPNTPGCIRAILGEGGHVAITFDALIRKLEEPDFLALFGYDATGVAQAAVTAEWFETDRECARPEAPVRLAGDLAPVDARVLAWGCLEACERAPFHVPVVSVKEHASGGRAFVWNIATFGHDAFRADEQLNVPERPGLFRLPKAVLDILRDSVTQPLGFTLGALARVACFVFESRLVLVNYDLRAREVCVKGLDLVPDSIESDSANTILSGHTVFLAPRSFAVIELKRA